MRGFKMNIRTLFLLVSVVLPGIAHAMEIPATKPVKQNTQQQIGIFEKFAVIARAIVGQANVENKQLINTFFDNYFITIFTKAVKQSQTAQLSEIERKTFNEFINFCMQFKSPSDCSKIINAIGNNQNIRAIITKIIGDKTAQITALTEAFAKVDKEYASQEQIAQLIAYACTNQVQPAAVVSTTLATSTTNTAPRPTIIPANTTKTTSTTSSNKSESKKEERVQLVDDQQASFELAWKLEQEKEQKRQNRKMRNNDLEIAKARSLSQQTDKQLEQIIDPEEEQLRIVMEESKRQSERTTTSKPTNTTTSTTSTKKSIPAAFVPVSFEDLDAIEAAELDLVKQLSLKENKTEATNTTSQVNKREETNNNNKSQQLQKQDLINCMVCHESFAGKDFVLALNQDDRNNAIRYVASNPDVSQRDKTLKQRIENCIHTICEDCKKRLEKGYQPEGQESQHVLIKILCPACDIRMRQAK